MFPKRAWGGGLVERRVATRDWLMEAGSGRPADEPAGKYLTQGKPFRIIGRAYFSERPPLTLSRNSPNDNTGNYGFSASSQVQTNLPQPGQPLPYFSCSASAKSTPATLAMVASQAITSANSPLRSS